MKTVPNRILIVADSYLPDVGGMATSIAGMATALRAAEIGVAVAWIASGAVDSQTDYEGNGIRVFRRVFKRGLFRLPMQGIRESARLLRPIIGDVKPTQIWARKPTYAVALARYYRDIPFVYICGNSHPISIGGSIAGTARSDLVNRAKLAYLFLMSGKWEKEILRSCYRTIVFSRDGRAQFEERYREHVAKVRIVHPGITKKALEAPAFPVAREWLHREWDIPNQRKLIVYVGHVGRGKLTSLVEAAGLLKEEHADIYERCHFLLVGPCPDTSYFVRHASSIGVSDHVTFCGVQKELLGSYYSGAWAHILPSHVESFGYVLVEAAICSTPSIAFSADGKRVRAAADDIIVDGETGLLARPGTAHGLAEAIAKALSWGQEERDRIGRNARDYVLGKFSWDKFVEEILAFSEE